MLGKNGTVDLVSVSINFSNLGVDIWAGRNAHSFWYSFWACLWANAHCLGCWSFGRRGNHNPSTKARAAIGVGQGIVVQSQVDYFAVQQLDLYRVGHADLEGQRFASASSAPF